jgi:hypothetical protein
VISRGSKRYGNVRKAIPVTGRGGPEGCETSRLSHILENRLTNGSEAISLTRRPAALYTQEDSWYSFLLGRLQAHSAVGSIRSIEKSNDLIGNRTRQLPACSTAPQPTTLPRDTFTRFYISIGHRKVQFCTLGPSTRLYCDRSNLNTFTFCLHLQ